MKKAKAKKSDAENDRTGPGAKDVCKNDAPQAGETKPVTAPTPSETGTAPPASTVAELQARVASLEDSVLRAKADYRNLQRRITIERSEAVRYANAELIRSLLPVLDDFERSLAVAEDGDHVSAMVDGVRLVHDNLVKALRDHGLSMIDALHQPFDPNVHEAILQQPSEDHPDQTVITEVARGYRLQGRVLRPTKVIVSKADHEKPVRPEGTGEAEQEAKA